MGFILKEKFLLCILFTMITPVKANNSLNVYKLVHFLHYVLKNTNHINNRKIRLKLEKTNHATLTCK